MRNLNIHTTGKYTSFLQKHVNSQLDYRLDSLCSGYGSKTLMTLQTGATILTLNTSSLGLAYFSCHIDLSLPSAAYGFSAFIQEMSFSKSDSGCTEDFLQFGRDILFVTSHLSRKFCGTEQLLTEESYSDKEVLKTSKRNYVEVFDTEMDLWIYVKIQANQTQTFKSLMLVVTPFKLSCYSDESSYRSCGTSGYCIKKELWCDGIGNCPMTNDSFEGNTDHV